MSDRLSITVNDDNLSCEATAILLKMLNFPESDYHTAEELCLIFENDSLRTIKTALNELTEESFMGYGVDMTNAGQEVTTVSAKETEAADTAISEETEEKEIYVGF